MEDKNKKSKSDDLAIENELLKKQIEDLKIENEKLKKETDILKEEIKHLQKPKWAKSNKKPGKKSEEKKIGPKKGHPANPRKPVEQIPDQELMWVPEFCPEGYGLLSFPKKWHEHLQIDIPENHRFIVTKHVVGWSYCTGCKKYHGAEHEKLSNTKYGPNLHAYAAYLKFDLGMTLGKIQRLIEGQYNLKISTGILSEMVSRCGNKFKSEYQALKINLKNTSHLHADETGWRNGGNNEWLWSFSNENTSVYVIEPSRGQKVVQSVLGDSYGGILISDFYAGYNKISCRKQKCWTHLLRELHVLKEKHPDDREVLYFSLRLKRFFERANELKKKIFRKRRY